MKNLKLICVALVILMLTSCGFNPSSFAKYSDEKHDVIVYEGREYLLAEGYVIHSRSLDNPSGNSADLIDYDKDEPAWLDSIFGGLGTFVFYSDNKTILYVMDTDGDKYYIRNDKYDYYISLLEGEEPPAFYLKSDQTKTITLLDEECRDVLGDTLYGDGETISYEDYSSGEGFAVVGELYGGEDDWEFYCSEYSFYYSNEFGFGIAEDESTTVHLIPREYDELFGFSMSSSDTHNVKESGVLSTGE